MRPKWLPRKSAPSLPRMKLCLSAAQLKQAGQAIGLNSTLEFPVGHGCMHSFTHPDRDLVCLVCMDPHEDDITNMGLLCHEAVHVFQAYCSDIGERQPASEQMAYGIQHIFQALAAEYVRLTEKPALVHLVDHPAPLSHCAPTDGTPNPRTLQSSVQTIEQPCEPEPSAMRHAH